MTTDLEEEEDSDSDDEVGAGALGIVLSYNLGPFFDGGSVFDDMAKTIYAWESEGNIREGEWLDRFEASPQYEAFLQDLYARIEFLDGKSLVSLNINKSIRCFIHIESQSIFLFLYFPYFNLYPYLNLERKMPERNRDDLIY